MSRWCWLLCMACASSPPTDGGAIDGSGDVVDAHVSDGGASDAGAVRCSSDVECSNGDVCDGDERCDLGTGECVAGAPLECDDGDPCTDDTCDPAGGCVSVLADGDGDGHAPGSRGECGTDCDDTDRDIHPGAQELCTPSVDEDCDGDPNPATAPVWYLDCDGDGYAAGTMGASSPQCDAPAPVDGCGWVTRVPTGTDRDCDDRSAAIHPEASEIAGDPGDTDESCDGVVECYVDADGDGYRGLATVAATDGDCTDPGEARDTPIDCDDSTPAISPMAPEVPGDPDDRDESCDGVIACFVDRDGDGARASEVIDSPDGDCGSPGEAYASSAVDCDDAAPDRFPGASEVAGDAGDVDEDCDGITTCFVDADGDGARGDESIASSDADCDDEGEAREAQPLDCRDDLASVGPSRAEIPGDPGDLDENCDGVIACYADADLDGARTDVVNLSSDADCMDPGEAYASMPSGDCNDEDDSIHPGATEVCNGIDDDCDGVEPPCGECGDGIRSGEECDDGNTLPCDGCSPTCQLESQHALGPGLETPIPDDGYNGGLASMACVNVPVVGDGDIGYICPEIGMDHTWVGDLTIRLVSPTNVAVTLMSRPGFFEPSDDGTNSTGDSSDLSRAYPILFAMIDGAESAERMGNGLSNSQVVCRDDGVCTYRPDRGAASGGDLDAFVGLPARGTWRLCVGDSGFGDAGVIDIVRLFIGR